MAKGPPVADRAESTTLVPAPVSDGTDHLESLGSFIDGVLGDRRIRRAVESEMTSMVLAGPDAPVDPEPVQPPPPVPGGTDTESRGGQPRDPG
jgi:hypothetical protein